MSARYGSQALAVGARPGTGAADGAGIAGSVDTAAVVAGFGGGHCAARPPRGRTAMPAALR
jgi:hypothetical protein